jgi:hypothetical protein
MSETLLKSLGAALPVKVEERPISTKTDVAPPSDDKIINEANKDLDVIINQGIVAMKEAFTKASDWKPSDQNRSREVGAALMAATLGAIAQKQKVALKRIDQRAKNLDKPASGLSGNSITNVFADRSLVLEMIEKNGLTHLLAKQNTSEDPTS